MDNKMPSTAKFCKNKKILKISQAKLNIKYIKREVKILEECFKNLDGYGIEIGQNSFINFGKEKDYTNLLKIEDQIKKLYELLLKEKCTKKYIYKKIDTINKNLNDGEFEEINIFIIHIKVIILLILNFLIFVFMKMMKKEITLNVILVNSKMRN